MVSRDFVPMPNHRAWASPEQAAPPCGLTWKGTPKSLKVVLGAGVRGVEIGSSQKIPCRLSLGCLLRGVLGSVGAVQSRTS
jgi:hypothetical protein